MTDTPVPPAPVPTPPTAPVPAAVPVTSPAVTPTPAPPAPVIDAVIPDVMRFANRLHGFAIERGHPELAKLIEVEAGKWKDTSVRVVVAGEIKRGKTSFINALFGRPQLLPVDADVATSVYLAVTYNATPEIEVTRRDLDETQRFLIAPDDLVHYASMQGDAARRRGVQAVEVRLPEPLLERGLVLIDTPGVGGMSRGHRDIALASLQVADALLFTVSSQEPIQRSELQFLAEASARIDTVVFMLTKVDANAEWPRMLGENRAKMRLFGTELEEQARVENDEEAIELARRFVRLYDAPFLPVSSRMAERAQVRAQAGRTDQAADFYARSGFADLHQILDRTVASREDVRLKNILILCGLIIARLESDERDRLRIAKGDHLAVEQELAAQKKRLEELLPRQAKWRQKFGMDVQRIQTEVSRMVAREATRIEKHYRQYVAGVGKEIDDRMDALPDDIEQTLAAAWMTLSQGLIERLEVAVAKMATEFKLEDLELEFGQLSATDSLTELDVRDRRDLDASKVSLLDHGLPLLTSASAMGGMLAKTFGASGGLMLPGLLVAAPVAYFRYKKQHQAKVRQEYVRIVREVLGTMRQEFTSELSLKLIEARGAIEETVDDALARRRAEIETKRRELTEFLKEDKPRQQQLAAEAAARLKWIEEQRTAIDALRGMIDGRAGARTA